MKIAAPEGTLEAVATPVQVAMAGREKPQATPAREPQLASADRACRTSPDPTWCTDRYRLVTPYSLRL